MSTPQNPPADEPRITADEVKTRLQSGEPVTMLDVRNEMGWEAIPVRIVGAIRIRPADWRIDESWPKGQITVVY